MKRFVITVLALAALALPASASAATVYSGVSARLTTSNSVTYHAAQPNLKLVSVMVNWKTVQPYPGSVNWSSLDKSMADARDHGYKLIVRVMCGSQSPSWLYSDVAHKVTPVHLIATDGGMHTVTAPLPWDPDLLYHYQNLVASLQTWLSGSDGTLLGTRADHVLFVPIAMPTVQGTEMPLDYGRGRFTGTYKGVWGTYDVATVNRTEWLANAVSGTTATQRLASNRASLKAAWMSAIDAHMRLLPSVPSAIAYGGLFGDAYAAAKQIAANVVPKYPTRLWSMTNNLRPKVYADGTLGPYRSWDANADAALRYAIGAGGVVGFQTAGANVLDSSAKLQYAVEDALSTYHARFIETSPTIVNRDAGYLLTSTSSVQLRMQANLGG
jgi:hypothetical protein